MSPGQPDQPEAGGPMSGERGNETMSGERGNETTGTLGVDLSSIRRRLRERRDRFVELRRQQRGERDQLLDSDPLDTGDHAQRDEGVDLLDHLDAGEQREVQAMDAALARIEAGTYGVCARCGDPISPRRLEAIPETTLCVTCAELASIDEERVRNEHGGTKL